MKVQKSVMNEIIRRQYKHKDIINKDKKINTGAIADSYLGSYEILRELINKEELESIITYIYLRQTSWSKKTKLCKTLIDTSNKLEILVFKHLMRNNNELLNNINRWEANHLTVTQMLKEHNKKFKGTGSSRRDMLNIWENVYEDNIRIY